MILTTAGDAFYQAAKKIQATEHELDNIISDIKELKSGTITIGTTPFRASCMLPDSMTRFKNLHPGIQIQIVIDSIQNLKQQLLEGKLDFCVEANIFEPNIFRTEPLSFETNYLAVSSSHPFNKGMEHMALTKEDICLRSEKFFQTNEISIRECGNTPFLSLDPQNDTSNVFQNLCRTENFEPNLAYVAYNLEIMFHWITAGYGIGLIPDTQIRFGNYNVHPYYYKLADPKGTFGMSESEIVIAYTPKHFFTRASKEYLILLHQLIMQGEWFLNSHS